MLSVYALTLFAATVTSQEPLSKSLTDPLHTGHEAPPRTMSKVVVQREEAGSRKMRVRLAPPITVYRAGVTFSRSESPTPPGQAPKHYLVTSERDSWDVDIATSSATHTVDDGPTFAAILPIVSPSGGLAKLEYGREESFFREHGATNGTDESIQGTTCTVLSTRIDGFDLSLFTGKSDGQIRALDAGRSGSKSSRFVYLSYESALPMRPELFKPPSGLSIREH